MKEPVSYLAPDVEIEGTIVSEEPVRFDGMCRGSIAGKSLIIIGTSAKIYGLVQAQSMIINGIIEGDLILSQSVTILSHGKIVGKIVTPPGGISMAKGGNFRGNMQARSISDLTKQKELRPSQTQINAAEASTENQDSSSDVSKQNIQPKDTSEEK
ncbi:MAG: polymer-forming cytoskeletal protein [SAR324 cluster bacterium]|nr:polymer-forming cytoskeletal protein [SAR324 cluster bacterium]